MCRANGWLRACRSFAAGGPGATVPPVFLLAAATAELKRKMPFEVWVSNSRGPHEDAEAEVAGEAEGEGAAERRGEGEAPEAPGCVRLHETPATAESVEVQRAPMAAVHLDVRQLLDGGERADAALLELARDLLRRAEALLGVPGPQVGRD